MMPAYKKSEWQQLASGETVDHRCVFMDQQGEIHAIDSTGRVLGVKVLGKKVFKAPRRPIRWFKPRARTNFDSERMAAAKAKRDRRVQARREQRLKAQANNQR